MDNNQQQEFEKAGEYSTSLPNNYSWDNIFKQTKKYISENKPVILLGPPGTGKTKMIYDIKLDLEKDGILGNFDVVQFHKKFAYEDFIEGFAPNEEGKFIKKDGIFKSFIKNSSDKQVDLFVIDEINRAEIATTFGEVMFLIEDRSIRSLKTSHFGDNLTIPNNLSIVGTMNTADRNIAILDYALRRRFVFIPLFPDYEELLKIIVGRTFKFEDFSPEEYVKAAKILNKRISSNRLMGRNMQIGQTMFVPTSNNDPITKEMIVENFRDVILPQLEAYCGFGYEDQLNSLLNPTVANKYINQQMIEFEDVIGMIRDLNNESR